MKSLSLSNNCTLIIIFLKNPLYNVIRYIPEISSLLWGFYYIVSEIIYKCPDNANKFSTWLYINRYFDVIDFFNKTETVENGILTMACILLGPISFSVHFVNWVGQLTYVIV